MSLKHIYWFTYFDKSEPSIRYRCYYPLQKIQSEQNISHSIIYPGYSPKSIARFILYFLRVSLSRRNDSLVVFQKIRTNRVYGTFLKTALYLNSKNTLYDIDDAEYLTHSKKTIDFFLRKCKTVHVGSEELVKYSTQYRANTILQTSPVIDHLIRKKTKNDLFTIGWIGYYTAHKQNLEELILPILDNISYPTQLILLGVDEQHRKQIQQRFIHNKHVMLNIPENIDWYNEENIYRMIGAFDIGLSPLLNNEKNRAKSAFKLKQYLSCGVPVLASPVGENNSFILDGLNGYICNTVSDFSDKIEKIRAMAENEYYQLSEAALQSISLFNMDNYCGKLINAYQTAT